MKSLIDQKFGDLVVLRLASRGRRGLSWICQCQLCNKEVKMTTFMLTKGSYKSCGCQIGDWSDILVHPTREVREAHKLTYVTWKAMTARVFHAREGSIYKNVVISTHWYVFDNFLEQMGDRPSINHSIDRINPKKGYWKGNCRWITKSENSSRTTFTQERRKSIGERMKKRFAEGNGIKLTEDSRARIAAGAKKRAGRTYQQCTKCGSNAFLPVCQKCRKSK